MNTPALGDVDAIHRLRNHICIVVGFCELLLAETPEGDPRRADLTEMHRAALAALAIMSDVGRSRRSENET
jgi:hypothetical protein